MSRHKKMKQIIADYEEGSSFSDEDGGGEYGID